jgi:hydroxyethylthiazole kinase-like uncharacterized protein yjeF
LAGRAGMRVLRVGQMARADALTIESGRLDSYGLMRNAGTAIARHCLERFGGVRRFAVLCGPGNNGGDGYVVARLLAEAGHPVDLFVDGAPRPATDAARAAADCPLPVLALEAFRPEPGCAVVDALYGAGLTRGLEGAAAEAARACVAAGVPVIAADLPSGVSGDSGQVATVALEAALTVTFAALKPAHLLQPGRRLCGRIVVADIGIDASAIETAGGDAAALFENGPALWRALLPRPDVDAHKYRRGHAAVFSGGPASTGAARLAAMAAARAGAGAVTLLSPGNAMAVNAAHLTSIMLRRCDSAEEARQFVDDRSPGALVLGPGFGVGDRVRETALAILGAASTTTLVLDADGITAFRNEPASLFDAAGDREAARLVLTPHEGEFARLFPDIAAQRSTSKVDRARASAARSHSVLVYKGPDTVIAAPDGRGVINSNGVPWLATAGSGDVLAGIIAGLGAQGMPPFEAACAAVWLHAEAAARFGPGLIAEDLPRALVAVLQDLLEWHRPERA